MIIAELNSIQAVEQALAWATTNAYTVTPHKQEFIICPPCAKEDATCLVMQKAGEIDMWYNLAKWVRYRFIELV